MKITIVKNTIPVGFSWLPPEEVEVKEELGQQLVEDGYAVLTTAEKKTDEVPGNKQSKPANKSKSGKRTSKGNT